MTIDTLIAGLNGKAKYLFEFYDPQKQYTYTIDSNRIYVSVNQAVPADYLTWPSASQYPHFVSGSPGYWEGNGSYGFQRLQSITSIASDQTGHIIAVVKRNNTAVRAMIFAMAQSGSNNHKLLFRWNASSDSPASQVCIEHIDGTGLVLSRAGFVNTNNAFQLLDFISNGSAWDLQLAGVSQSLTLTGSNAGAWFGDLTSPNRGNVGISEASSNIIGQNLNRFLLICNAPLTAPERALVATYITDNNLLA